MNAAEDNFHLGVKAIIRNAAGKVLLLKVNPKKLHNISEAYWDIPGGRIQRGSTVEETLQREIEEEIGVKEIRDLKPVTMVLSNIRIPVKTSDVGLILAVYSCTIDSKTPIILSEEHIEAAWFDMSEAAQLLQFKYPKSFTKNL